MFEPWDYDKYIVRIHFISFNITWHVWDDGLSGISSIGVREMALMELYTFLLGTFKSAIGYFLALDLFEPWDK